MKTIPTPTIEETTPVVPESKIVEILAIINLEWETYYTAEELAASIENGYIFGPYGISEHYQRDFIMDLIKEVDLEKNPPAPIVEEPVVLPEELINQA